MPHRIHDGKDYLILYGVAGTVANRMVETAGAVVRPFSLYDSDTYLIDL
jgi:hypothetical protein